MWGVKRKVERKRGRKEVAWLGVSYEKLSRDRVTKGFGLNRWIQTKKFLPKPRVFFSHQPNNFINIYHHKRVEFP